MRDPVALFDRELGGSDVEVAINLEGIAVDDLATECLTNVEREIAFSRSGGSDDGDERAQAQFLV